MLRIRRLGMRCIPRRIHGAHSHILTASFTGYQPRLEAVVTWRGHLLHAKPENTTDISHVSQPTLQPTWCQYRIEVF
jgi:hypothetical protein